jgi:hypothetical protein
MVMKAELVTRRSTTDASDVRAWTLAEDFDDWSLICCHKPHLDLLTDPGEFLLTHRGGTCWAGHTRRNSR